ncbi:MAG: type VI secretion system protein TssL [Alphaproteobacteria bacterium]|nr:type VI secretion system protein TssL [Alphaproteobacteria bacterium]
MIDDDDSTILIPNPGGRLKAAARPPSTHDMQEERLAALAPSPEPPALARAAARSTNPLVAAAGPLLQLLVRLRSATGGPDVDGLRRLVVDTMRGYERVIADAVPAEQARAAHYALCATIDDVVQNTPWGSQSTWVKQSVVSQFHRDVTGGDRFFEILARYQSEPERSGGLLELMYLCLSLGFEGRLRVLPRGSDELARLRENLFEILGRRGDRAQDLSPRWRGLSAPHRGVGAAIPLWVFAAGAVASLTALYMILLLMLNDHSDDVFGRLVGLPPRGPVTIERPGSTAPLPQPAPTQAPRQMERVRVFLEKEVAEGLVEVTQTNGSVLVRLRGSGMFDSGSAKLVDRYLPVVERVAKAIEQERGAVVVAGHTDNVPIRRSLLFPSNFHLSEARAANVRTLIAAHLGDPSRVKSEGRADAEPLVPNDTPDNRAVNRRIDIMLARDEGR